jgi:hypothetical protein
VTGSPDQIITAIIVTGAAGAFFWVLRQIIDGKLHSSSEVDGLRQDKADLLRINAAISKQLADTNSQLREVIALLKEGK